MSRIARGLCVVALVCASGAARAAGGPPLFLSEQGQIAQQARDALDGLRAGLTTACWKPPAGAKSGQDFEFRLIFDPKGQLASYAVNDPADKAYRSIAQCLREHKPAFSVAPVGQHVTVQLALAFP